MGNIWESPQEDAQYREGLIKEAKKLRPTLNLLLTAKEEQLAPLRARVDKLNEALRSGKSIKNLHNIDTLRINMDDAERDNIIAELATIEAEYLRLEHELDNTPEMRGLVERMHTIRAERGGMLWNLPELQDLPIFPEPSKEDLPHEST